MKKHEGLHVPSLGKRVIAYATAAALAASMIVPIPAAIADEPAAEEPQAAAEQPQDAESTADDGYQLMSIIDISSESAVEYEAITPGYKSITIDGVVVDEAKKFMYAITEGESLTPTLSSIATTDKSYTFEGLDPKTTYYVWIFADDDENATFEGVDESKGYKTQITTADDSVAPVIKSLTSPEVGQAVVTLKAKVAGAAKYKYEIATDSAFKSIVKTATVEDKTYTFTGLKNTTKYYVRVTPLDAQDVAGASVTGSLTTRDKAGNIDKYIKKAASKDVLTIGVAKKKIKIYKDAKCKKSFGKKFEVDPQCCVVINRKALKKLKQGYDYKYLKIDLLSAITKKSKIVKSQVKRLKKYKRKTYAYVKISTIKLDTINTANFGMKLKEGRNKLRAAAAKYAVDRLGVWFKNSGDSLVKGLDCASFVCLSLRKAGMKTKVRRRWAAHDLCFQGRHVSKDDKRVGDMVFYRKHGSKVATHSALYIGKGYVAMCSGPRGNPYPRAGSRIAKVTFRGGQYEQRDIIGG